MLNTLELLVAQEARLVATRGTEPIELIGLNIDICFMSARAGIAMARALAIFALGRTG